MAVAGDIQVLHEEATCSICLDYFRDPVIAECGHSFCQGCLTRYRLQNEGNGLAFSCPQCRETIQQRNLTQNQALKNMVEIAKKLSFQDQGKNQGGYGVCRKHQEPLKLFCKDHDSPICMVCDRSNEHRSHKVVPQEEAFQEYKKLFCSRLKNLRAERKKILKYEADTEKESQDLLNQTEQEIQKTMEGFHQISQFLIEQKKSFLAQIEKLKKEITRRREECMVRFNRELSSLENLIKEIEEKSQQPVSEFLQDSGKMLQRSEKEAFEYCVTFPPLLTSRIRIFYDAKHFLDSVREQIPANVTLDPDTAHPRLILSKDCKSVRRGLRPQVLPNNPERFDKWHVVLGGEGFTVGKHFWEVSIGNEGEWAVGVARKSVRRKGWFAFSIKGGICAVGKSIDEYRIFNTPDFTPLSFKEELKRIRVTLNCDERQVSFSDADTGVCLYTHSGTSFFGETLLPFFYIYGKAHLILSSSLSEAVMGSSTHLVIFSRPDQLARNSE